MTMLKKNTISLCHFEGSIFSLKKCDEKSPQKGFHNLGISPFGTNDNLCENHHQINGFSRLVFRRAKNENSFNPCNSMIKTKFMIFDIGDFMSSHYVRPFSRGVGSRDDRKARKMINILVIIFTLITSTNLIAQIEYNNLSLSENYRIHPSDVIQTEVFITISPYNEDILFSSCNTLTFIPFFVSEGIFITEDGGNTWHGNDKCTGEPMDFHGGDPGIAIDKDGRFILTRLGRLPFVGLYSHFSTDNGATWSFQTAISTDDLERASVTTDAVVVSPNYGRTYATWVKFSSPFPMMFSYVDSENNLWSVPVQINSPTNRSAGGDIAVGPGGEIYSCWAGVTETSPFKEIYVGFASSIDGGINWVVIENAFDVNGITGLLPEKGNIRVNGLPGLDVDKTGGERNGWIYIVTGQKNHSPAGSDPDIILNRSSDGGITWSSGIRVNQDAISNGKIQYFPTVHVDKFGAVNIIFYDDRNTTSDSTGVFLARSTDGGDTWKEYEISDHNYKPTPIGGLGQGYQGDNIDITSTSTKLWPVWMDNSTGTYQIWTSPIDFTSLAIIDQEEEPSIILKQNFPNPFNNNTTIGYTVHEQGYVSISIIDLFGNALVSLVNENKLPGYYEVSFSTNELGLNSGTYFYQLKSDKQKESKIMILSN